jgi:hypothetical protein
MMQRDFRDQPLPEDAAEAIKTALFAGRKIEAIKLYRQISGQGLKEAKDFVEDLEEELRVSDPTRFVTGPRGKGCGVGVLAILAVIWLASVVIA